METFEIIIRYSVYAALAFYAGLGLYALTEHIKFDFDKGINVPTKYIVCNALRTLNCRCIVPRWVGYRTTCDPRKQI